MIKKSHIEWAGRRFGPAVTSIKSAAVLLCAAAALTAQAGGDSRGPELPPVCARIAAPEGNNLVFHVFAVGVQIYRWDGTAWAFVAPEAVLYADAGHHAQVGTHFATPNGPAWESTSGSKVVETRVDGCTPDPTAIPWLLLRTIAREGSGIFSGVTYVQRVNTGGGLAPSAPGAFVGEERQVPYTAEYFFYRGPERFRQNNLVSDLPGVARLQDTNLVNAWGVSFGGAGPFWVNSNGKGKSTLYAVTNDASGAEVVTKQTLEVTIPGAGKPTGVVNNNQGGFNGDVFLFASLDGVISGWRGALGTTAEILATRPTAIYTGLALATNSSGPLLLAANFAEGTLDAYGTNASLLAQFTDASAPAGYAPFNVQVVGGAVFVMFAKHEDGRGRGLIDVFDPETGAFHRFATGTDAGGNLAQINSPWGVALAPESFGRHGGDLLVGNFGNGTIMTFGPDGKFHGLLKDVHGGPIEIERLWGLSFGNGGRAGNPDTLFFASGPLAETHGLFGTLKPADESDPRD
ncbi:MAG: TIGR03118 family protein [Gammaproteobacteria bacterium]